MTNLAPAIKGQLTKIVNTAQKQAGQGGVTHGTLYHAVRKVFLKVFPPEQAKHATRKYLRTV